MLLTFQLINFIYQTVTTFPLSANEFFYLPPSNYKLHRMKPQL